MAWTAFDELTVIEGATLVWFGVSPSMTEVRFALTYLRDVRQAVCTVFEVGGVQELYWVRRMASSEEGWQVKPVQMDYVREVRQSSRLDRWSQLAPKQAWFELRLYWASFEIEPDGEPSMGIVGHEFAWSGGSPIDERALSHIDQLPVDLRSPSWGPLRP